MPKAKVFITESDKLEEEINLWLSGLKNPYIFKISETTLLNNKLFVIIIYKYV